ncbi:Membrane metallo-endopeptidase-like 1 [Mactra antiquata]
MNINKRNNAVLPSTRLRSHVGYKHLGSKKDETGELGDQLLISETLTNSSNGRSSQFHFKLLLLFLIFFIVSTVSLIVAIVVTNLSGCQDKSQGVPAPGTDLQSSQGVCLTRGCVLAAARVESAMDETVKPCDDFYEFACGQWLRKHVIPEDKSSYGTFTGLRDDVDIILKAILEANVTTTEPAIIMKVRNYFKACVNEEKIEELGLTYIHNFMEGYGGWPVLGSNPGGHWDPSTYNLEELLIYAKKHTNYIPLIDVGITTDDKNPDKHILYIDQPDLGMPSRDYYLKGRDDKTLMAYQTMLEELAVEFGADKTMATTFAKDLVDMEIELANITVPKEERRDPEKLYNKMTLGELSNNFTGVDWKKLIRGVMDHVAIPLDDSEPVIAIAPPFLSKIGALISKYSDKVIADYVVASSVQGKTFYLPRVFTAIKLRYQKVLTGSETVPPRWQSCSNSVKNAMPEVVGRLFVAEEFKKEAKLDVENLVSKLRKSFKEMIDALPWMETKTKGVAKEKADYIEARIGYSELVYNDTVMAEKYENITVYVDDPLKTLVSIGDASVIRTLNKLRKDVDKTEWGMSPATVNAYYSPSTNQITFPAAILQPPFYTHDQPAYLNYGGIGYVIGHEITHGFDDQGRLFDKDGNLQNWWSNVDSTKFKERAQCIIDQYGNFTVPGTGGMKLNGINTQGENIADNGGIKESFKAYRDWIATERQGVEEDSLPGMSYTPNQLYFINAAQSIWTNAEF